MFYMTYRYQLIEMTDDGAEIVQSETFQTHKVHLAQARAIRKVSDISTEWGTWEVGRHPIDGEEQYICHSLTTPHTLAVISLP